MQKIKINTLFFLFFGLFILGLNSVCAAQDIKIEFTVNGRFASVNDMQVPIDKNTAAAIFTQNDRTMVPIQFVRENLGLEVVWNEDTDTALFQNEDTAVCLTLNSDAANVNGKNIPIDCSVVIKENQVFVPIRFIAENFLYGVYWDAYANRVIMKQEHNVDIHSEDVQNLLDNINTGKSFACYSAGYADTELFDTTNYSWMGGIYRELIALLSMNNSIDHIYTDDEAAQIIKDFLSAGCATDNPKQNELDALKRDLENGIKFGDGAAKIRLAGVLSKAELETYNQKMFGAPLPNLESCAYPIAYASFFFFSRNNIVNFISPEMPQIWCTVYYNQANGKYLFMRELESFCNYTDESYEPFKQDTRLVKATKHNDEISVHLYHENEFAMYSGGTDFYKGTYINTYKMNGDNYQWIGSYGIDE